jgi:hypothetical protein
MLFFSEKRTKDYLNDKLTMEFFNDNNNKQSLPTNYMNSIGIYIPAYFEVLQIEVFLHLPISFLKK